MQAFKAANPRATLADFVRWHSPRDWIPNEDGSDSLSARMLEPGNLWQVLWNVSSFAFLIIFNVAEIFIVSESIYPRMRSGYQQPDRSHYLIICERVKRYFCSGNIRG